MLGKSQRLSRTAFSTAFRSGRRYQSPHLTLIHAPAAHFAGAVVVGKKVAKSAVTRNRVRRRLTAALRESSVITQNPGAFIMITKPGAANISSRVLRAELQALLARVDRDRAT
jgi:ribonuclease P protein component